MKCLHRNKPCNLILVLSTLRQKASTKNQADKSRNQVPGTSDRHYYFVNYNEALSSKSLHIIMYISRSLMSVSRPISETQKSFFLLNTRTPSNRCSLAKHFVAQTQKSCLNINRVAVRISAIENQQGH